MGSDPASENKRAGLESQLRFPGRWAISFAVMITFAEVIWSGTSWAVGAMWGAITGGTMWIYGRSKRGRPWVTRRIENLVDPD